jgi:hypothetical protein
MINKDSKQKLDEVVAQAAQLQTDPQKLAQALAPGAAQQQDRDSFFNVSTLKEDLDDDSAVSVPSVAV